MVVVGIRSVGRPQFLGTLVSLWNMRDLWDTLVLMGPIDEGSMAVLNDLQRRKKVIWDDRLGTMGERGSMVFYHMIHLGISDNDYAVFLDDDIVFDYNVFHELLMAASGADVVNMVLNMVQDTHWDVEVLRGMNCFHWSSAVRGNIVRDMKSEDLWLYSRVKGAGEQFYVHWMLHRSKGSVLNTITIDSAYRRPLHLWVRDRFKTWIDLPVSYWNGLYEGFASIESLEDIEKFMKDRRMLDE